MCHLGTIRGDLGLNRCLFIGPRIVNVVDERQEDGDTRVGNGAEKSRRRKVYFSSFKS